jgi:hypothetical protein
MLHPGPALSLEAARARLGLAGADGPGDLQAAFHRTVEAARLNPDLPHGVFREILEAYRILRTHFSEQPGGDARRFDYWPSVLELTVTEAVVGGPKTGRLPTGRPFTTRLPGGLRDGDLAWVHGWLLQVKVDHEPGLEIRGADLWITVRRRAAEMKPDARVTVETPAGPWTFRLSPESVEAKLARVPKAGLAASRGRPAGDLYVRFVVDETAERSAVSFIRRLIPVRRAA